MVTAPGAHNVVIAEQSVHECPDCSFASNAPEYHGHQDVALHFRNHDHVQIWNAGIALLDKQMHLFFCD